MWMCLTVCLSGPCDSWLDKKWRQRHTNHRLQLICVWSIDPIAIIFLFIFVAIYSFADCRQCCRAFIHVCLMGGARFPCTKRFNIPHLTITLNTYYIHIIIIIMSFYILLPVYGLSTVGHFIFGFYFHWNLYRSEIENTIRDYVLPQFSCFFLFFVFLDQNNLMPWNRNNCAYEFHRLIVRKKSN